MDELINKIKFCTKDDLKKLTLQLEADLLLYKIKDIHSIFGNSIKKRILPLPLAVDSDKDKYIIHYCKQKYQMELCLDPNTIILSKEDYGVFQDNDLSKILFSFCQSIMILKEKSLGNIYFSGYTYNLSPDKKRVIINFTLNNHYDYQDNKFKQKVKKNDAF